MLPEWIHDEFVNWARWLSAGGPPGPRREVPLASAERDFIREFSGYGEAEVTPPAPIARRAEIVQRVYRGQMSRLEQRVVDAEYPERERSGRDDGVDTAAARIGLTGEQYRAILLASGRLVARGFAG